MTELEKRMARTNAQREALAILNERINELIEQSDGAAEDSPLVLEIADLVELEEDMANGDFSGCPWYDEQNDECASVAW